MARLCNYLSSLPSFSICTTFVAAPKLGVYHHSIAWYPSVEEISSNLSHIFLSASQSASRRLQEKGQSAAIPLKGHVFVTLVDTSVHRVMYQLPLSNMRAGDWWINTSKSHDSLPWSREEKGKEPFRESPASVFWVCHVTCRNQDAYLPHKLAEVPPLTDENLPALLCLHGLWKEHSLCRTGPLPHQGVNRLSNLHIYMLQILQNYLHFQASIKVIVLHWLCMNDNNKQSFLSLCVLRGNL